MGHATCTTSASTNGMVRIVLQEGSLSLSFMSQARTCCIGVGERPNFNQALLGMVCLAGRDPLLMKEGQPSYIVVFQSLVTRS